MTENVLFTGASINKSFEHVMNGDTYAKVHTFCGLLYVSFVYEKRSEYRKSVSVCNQYDRLSRYIVASQIGRRLVPSHPSSCKLRGKLILKVQGGVAVEQLTGPPIMVHVSVNQSEATVSQA